MFQLTTRADVTAARAEARRYKAQCEQHRCQPFTAAHYAEVARITEEMYKLTPQLEGIQK